MSFGNHPSDIVRTARKMFIELAHDMIGRNFLKFYRSFQNYFQNLRLFSKILWLTYLVLAQTSFGIEYQDGSLNMVECPRDGKEQIKDPRRSTWSNFIQLIIFLWMQGSIHKMKVSFKNPQANWEPQQIINAQEWYFRVALKRG